MTISELCKYLESQVPGALQEDYDNSGFQVGNPSDKAKAALLTIDITEGVVEEAVSTGCNLIISHHPLIFSPLKSVTTDSNTGRIIQRAIKNSIAIYTMHTNLDSVYGGVSFRMAEKLGLEECEVLKPMKRRLVKLVTFVPHDSIEKVRTALFTAGAGHIGDYDCCGYQLSGEGTFRAGDETDPYVGTKGELHSEPEIRFETILPDFLTASAIKALKESHPYEEPAYDIYPLLNEWDRAGLGCVGLLPARMKPDEFLQLCKETFGTPVLRYTSPAGSTIRKVALCGGSGVSLLNEALAAGADLFVTGDVKYHQFAEASGKIMLVDAGHWETEKFSMEVVNELLMKKFPNFALRFSKAITNPINFY